MKTQLQHHTTTFTKRQFSIILVCDRIQSPANIGGIFRIADSFGIKEIHFCGEDITVVSKRMERTARATHKMVSYFQHKNTLTPIKKFKALGYTILALEITTDSVPLPQYPFKDIDKIVLIIGEESSGVSTAVLKEATDSIHIQMYGNNSSMNVTTAAGIAAYEITKQLETTAD